MPRVIVSDVPFASPLDAATDHVVDAIGGLAMLALAVAPTAFTLGAAFALFGVRVF